MSQGILAPENRSGDFHRTCIYLTLLSTGNNQPEVPGYMPQNGSIFFHQISSLDCSSIQMLDQFQLTLI
jgi:hypothetical protein